MIWIGCLNKDSLILECLFEVATPKHNTVSDKRDQGNPNHNPHPTFTLHPSPFTLGNSPGQKRQVDPPPSPSKDNRTNDLLSYSDDSSSESDDSSSESGENLVSVESEGNDYFYSLDNYEYTSYLYSPAEFWREIQPDSPMDIETSDSFFCREATEATGEEETADISHPGPLTLTITLTLTLTLVLHPSPSPSPSPLPSPLPFTLTLTLTLTLALTLSD